MDIVLIYRNEIAGVEQTGSVRRVRKKRHMIAELVCGRRPGVAVSMRRH